MGQQHDDDCPLVGRHHDVHYHSDHLLVALLVAALSDVSSEDCDQRLQDLIRVGNQVAGGIFLELIADVDQYC